MTGKEKCFVFGIIRFGVIGGFTGFAGFAGFVGFAGFGIDKIDYFAHTS